MLTRAIVDAYKWDRIEVLQIDFRFVGATRCDVLPDFRIVLAITMDLWEKVAIGESGRLI